MSQTKFTVITGASSGIGYDAAKAFGARGKNLILIARRENLLEELKSTLLTEMPALEIIVKACDLSLPENVFRLYDELKPYEIETWINNAGFGNYDAVGSQDLQKILPMLHLNIEALTIFSTLFVRDYSHIPGTQLINIASVGGYTIVPTAVTYCATKFYVSAFTEGLAWELKAENAPMRAKVLAPAATQTEFGKVANDVSEFDYDTLFGTYHTSRQMADFLLALYDSDKTVGIVDRESFTFTLSDPKISHAGNSKRNQKISRKQ